MAISNANNFDLIRLAAALQVAVTHSTAHLSIDDRNWLFPALVDLFPGVPVFFFISGFLISKSFEKNPLLKEYGLNRVLRIYPGLIACFIVSLIAAWLTGYFNTVSVSAPQLFKWVAAQISFVQFYNPDFMRNYGVGVLNGSLWTIAVELQFYVLVPLVYALARLRETSRRRANGLLLALALLFLILNRVYVHSAEHSAEIFWYKLAGVSFAPWFYMFLFGVFCQRNFQVLQGWFGGRFVPLCAAYCVFGFIVNRYFDWGFGNTLNPVVFAVLSLVVFSAAFSRRTLSDRLLRRNDLSYGVYIYHMPVVNLWLVIGLAGSVTSLLAAVLATLLLAFLSWRWVEKPALGLKRHPLYQHAAAGS